MASLNSVGLLGVAMNAPELKKVGEHTKAAFRLLVSSRITKERDEKLFIEVECWDGQAETSAKAIVKWSNVLVTGRLRLDEWEDKNGGGKRSKIFVLADRVQFLDYAKRPEEHGAPPREEGPVVPPVVTQSSDIPY
jgi:single-strand DNA-binding protein